MAHETRSQKRRDGKGGITRGKRRRPILRLRPEKLWAPCINSDLKYNIKFTQPSPSIPLIADGRRRHIRLCPSYAKYSLVKGEINHEKREREREKKPPSCCKMNRISLDEVVDAFEYPLFLI